jgi:flagellar biosynthesis protein FlhB
LKMSPQEIREEMRQLQGDPQVAALRRGRARQLSAGRVTSVAVTAAGASADSVMTN